MKPIKARVRMMGQKTWKTELIYLPDDATFEDADKEALQWARDQILYSWESYTSDLDTEDDGPDVSWY